MSDLLHYIKQKRGKCIDGAPPPTPYMMGTGGLLIFLLFALLLILTVGVAGNMYYEGHTFGKAVGRTCVAIADREGHDEKIKHGVFGPAFYLLILVFNFVIIGIIGAEVAKRFLCASPQHASVAAAKPAAPVAATNNEQANEKKSPTQVKK